MVILVSTELLAIVKRESVFFYSIILRPTQDVISSYYVQLLQNIMDDEYITPDRNHSALLIIDVQCDFTLIGAVADSVD
jgi:hypothetical protein